jgi:translation elongation factor EF-4
MKLWKKQQKGKKKLEERSSVQISPETFKELLKR